MDNRRNTFSIVRIGHLAPTLDLGSRGGFEKTFKKIWICSGLEG